MYNISMLQYSTL